MRTLKNLLALAMGCFKTVTLQNVDSQLFEVIKSLVNLRTNIKIFQSEKDDVDISENTKKEEETFYSSVEKLKAKYSDLFENPDEDDELNHVFDNVRDYSEKLRGTEEEIWQ